MTRYKMLLSYLEVTVSVLIDLAVLVVLLVQRRRVDLKMETFLWECREKLFRIE